VTSPETLTHAVTVPQPLAWALASGHCPVIPSDTRPGLEHMGRLIGIHAGLSQVGSLWDFVSAQVPTEFKRQTEAAPPSFPRGALVGVARLVGVVRRTNGPSPHRWLGLMRGRSVCDAMGEEQCERIRPWWPLGAKWGLLLDEAVALSEPIPMRGAGGLWRISGGTTDGNGMNVAWALEQWRKGRAAQ